MGEGRGMNETKVVYLEKDEIRAIRGVLRESDNPDFFLLERRDGNRILINRHFVIKIEAEEGVR